MLDIVLALLAVAAGCFWAYFSYRVWRNLQAMPELPASDAVTAPAQPPRVSVIIAARDEQSRVEETIRRLLAQTGVTLEIVAVDDRSKDQTGTILDRLATEDARVTACHVSALPPGWLGKCHACHQGAQRATSPWLLFTDADIHMAPDLLSRAVATAERDQADHLCLLPGISSPGIITQSALLAWSACFLLYAPPALINSDRGKRGVGVGAFNMLTRSMYEKVGGHTALKMEVVDDVKMGLLVRRAGGRQRLYSGVNSLQAEWAASPFEMIRLLEKNWFAGVGYSVPAAVLICLLFMALVSLAIVAPVWFPSWGWLTTLAWLCTIVPAWRQARAAGWPKIAAVLSPLGFLWFVLAGVNSTSKALWRGGIRWRDTFYSLKELRAGRVK